MPGMVMHHVHSPQFVLGMWLLMSAAMMAPTALPMLRTYSSLIEGSSGRLSRQSFWVLLTGYLLVWSVFAVAASVLQLALRHSNLVDGVGTSTSLWLSGALLALAAGYQLSPLKQACVRRCRAPMAFLMSHWRDGPAGAIRLGLRHGLDCLGCCVALMLLAFVGGTLSIGFMLVATLIMATEKLPQLGPRVSQILTAVLAVSCVSVLALAMGVV